MHARPVLYMLAIAHALAISSCVTIPADEPGERLKSPESSLNEVPLTGTLQQYLAEKLPEFRLVTRKDYWTGWFDGENEDERKWLHWSLTADFDGNGMADYVFLMVGSVDGMRHVSLVAARAGESGWSHDVLVSYAWGRELVDRIGLEPAGRVFMGYEDDGQERTESLAFPSVEMGGLEQCPANRYYWKEGQWREAYIRL